ncbi:MAG: hypothetical protein DMENIID0002_05710 [Rickettsia endosymbiont of Sergentomyia squamirostris]|uniref:Uncharacterized protein n=1 Tax=Candidatus Tisiphia endosymbiont of Sergentomyia squamirostris TaxID=3113639 RepID=A0AAT9G803_9RICK
MQTILGIGKLTAVAILAESLDLDILIVLGSLLLMQDLHLNIEYLVHQLRGKVLYQRLVQLNYVKHYTFLL